MVESTLEGMMIEQPAITEEAPQNMCMDKGYDYPDIRELVEEWGHILHIKDRGDRSQAADTRISCQTLGSRTHT